MKVLTSPAHGQPGRGNLLPILPSACAPGGARYPDRPSNRKAAARSVLRDLLAEWGLKLTEAQRERLEAAALHVPSRPWMGQYSHLSGQTSSAFRSTAPCGLGWRRLEEPPAPVVFGPNPVTGLEIVNDAEDGVRLRLNVGATHEDIMVFGQPPCSAAG